MGGYALHVKDSYFERLEPLDIMHCLFLFTSAPTLKYDFENFPHVGLEAQCVGAMSHKVLGPAVQSLPRTLYTCVRWIAISFVQRTVC